MSNKGPRILQAVVQEWQEVRTAIEKMCNVAQVRPDDGWSIFELVSGPPSDTVEVRLKPVVFKMPERMYRPKTGRVLADLFVVIDGRLTITYNKPQSSDDLELITNKFASRAAYFRLSKGKLEHVCGIHYDFSLDERGHPVFHAQLNSLVDSSEYISEHFELGIDAPPQDYMTYILRNVRMPTAQMDFFSLFLQICADHLLGDSPGEEEIRAFNTILEKSKFLRGAGSQSTRLMDEAARSCYRARHWYPIAVANKEDPLPNAKGRA